jgi:hypothetical protein
MPPPAGAPVLRWHRCEGGFFCATLRVPLDYRRPDGRLISIAVIEHRATSRQPVDAPQTLACHQRAG